MNLSNLSWPPTFTIKTHPRARHVKLKVTLKHGLELITPKKFNSKEIPTLLEDNRAWIEKQLTKLQKTLQTGEQDLLPTKIVIPSVSQTWLIEYILLKQKGVSLLQRPHNQLVVLGNIENKLLCKKVLVKWLKKQAQAYLTEALHKISSQTQLTYNKLIIRNQTSCWGSCSADKTLSLNYKILFLPYHLVRHVLLHELCHTVHFDHSKAFWELMKNFDPDTEDHKRQLKKEEEYVPLWARLM